MESKNPLFFSSQLFTKAQCKGPDTQPSCCDLCDTQPAMEPVMRDLLLPGPLGSRCLPQLHQREARMGMSLFETSWLNEEQNKQKIADDKCSN